MQHAHTHIINCYSEDQLLWHQRTNAMMATQYDRRFLCGKATGQLNLHSTRCPFSWPSLYVVLCSDSVPNWFETTLQRISSCKTNYIFKVGMQYLYCGEGLTEGNSCSYSYWVNQYIIDHLLILRYMHATKLMRGIFWLLDVLTSCEYAIPFTTFSLPVTLGCDLRGGSCMHYIIYHALQNLSCTTEFLVYRARKWGMRILLSGSPEGPGRTGKQEQEQISPNHVQAFFPSSVHICGCGGEFY